MSECESEYASTETLSFRCKYERYRLMWAQTQYLLIQLKMIKDKNFKRKA